VNDPPSPKPPGPVSPSHDHDAEAIRRLYYSLDGEVRWVFLLPLLLVGGLWPWVEHRWLVLWLIPALAVPAWRYALVRRFLAAGAQTMMPELRYPVEPPDPVPDRVHWHGAPPNSKECQRFLNLCLPTKSLLRTTGTRFPDEVGNGTKGEYEPPWWRRACGD
jgi:hypothetical protein